MKARILKDLNERDHQPAANFTPQLAGAHFHKNLHVLQHREPGEQPLLGEGLDTSTGISVRPDLPAFARLWDAHHGRGPSQVLPENTVVEQNQEIGGRIH